MIILLALQGSNNGLSRVHSWELTLRETLPREGAGDFSPREDTSGIEKFCAVEDMAGPMR